jgi:hypothetical protein
VSHVQVRPRSSWLGLKSEHDYRGASQLRFRRVYMSIILLREFRQSRRELSTRWLDHDELVRPYRLAGMLGWRCGRGLFISMPRPSPIPRPVSCNRVPVDADAAPNKGGLTRASMVIPAPACAIADDDITRCRAMQITGQARRRVLPPRQTLRARF